jgi:hypothetical protein
VAETPTDRPPTTIPMPNLDIIRELTTNPGGAQELVVALRNIINAFNSYIIRKGP